MNRSSRSLEAKASHNLDGGPSAAQRRAAIVLLVFLVLMWGCNWPINKTILSYISPLWYACMRLGLGALSLFLAQAFLRVHIKPPSRMDIPIVLSVGIVQMAAVIALMTFGLSIVPAGRSSILSYTMPLWAVPGAILFLGERLQFGKAAALVLGMAGVAFMFNPTALDWSDHRVLIGNGCLLLSAALWAATIIHIRAHRWVGTSFELAPWQMLVGLIPLLAVALWIEGPPPQVNLTMNTIIVALYSGPLITALPFWAFLTVARTLPAMTTSLTLLLVPAVGLISSAILIGEPIDRSSVIGLLLITSAIAAVNLADIGKTRLRRNRHHTRGGSD
jgi:drug/metabolite transporter (DMT)-like permease